MGIQAKASIDEVLARSDQRKNGGGGETGVMLITAGASGIGREIAATYRRAGWSVFICDIDQSALDKTLAEDQGLTGWQADVTQPDSATDIIEKAVKRAGRIDVLINNAGTSGPTGPVESIDLAAWRSTLDVNLTGAFNFIRQTTPIMKRQGSGCIINMSSSAGLFGYPNRSAYAAAKWGVIGLTKTLAMELGPSGIRVNAICPGSVEGPRIEGVIERDAHARGLSVDAVRETYQKQTSLRTFVSAADIAEMCFFLSSPAGQRISGQAIAVDGHTETLSMSF